LRGLVAAALVLSPRSADDRLMSDGASRAARVPIVDDERVNCDLLERVLQLEGYETATAAKGKPPCARSRRAHRTWCCWT